MPILVEKNETEFPEIMQAPCTPPASIHKEERSGSTTSSGIASLTAGRSTPDEHQDLSSSPEGGDDHFRNSVDSVEQLAIALSNAVLCEPTETFGTNVGHTQSFGLNLMGGQNMFDPTNPLLQASNRPTLRPAYQHFDSDSGASSGENSVEEDRYGGSPGFGSHGLTPGSMGSDFSGYTPEWQMRRVSLNVTDNVPVPSSEHVAEIVGRQGCKIKALRAKTNTYIKTPVRGEDAVFVVTGRREDVEEAKQEILSAAEHFTQIRASRRHSQGGAPAPGHITAYVRVPYRVVGLVVGPKGGTIKRVQQETHTYIITPSRDREPIFEVTGLPENVEAARREIETHIYTRTGNLPISSGYDASYYAAAMRNHPAMGGANSPTNQGSPTFGESSPNPATDMTSGGGMVSQRNGYGNPLRADDFHLNGNDTAYYGETPQIQNPVISKPMEEMQNGMMGMGSGASPWGSSIFPPTSSIAMGVPGTQQSVQGHVASGPSYPIWSTGGLDENQQQPQRPCSKSAAAVPTAGLGSIGYGYSLGSSIWA